ncbi:hypothetical protein PFISCL1PPCAC_19781, partial [Pristionchus fissidentatus]
FCGSLRSFSSLPSSVTRLGCYHGRTNVQSFSPSVNSLENDVVSVLHVPLSTLKEESKLRMVEREKKDKLRREKMLKKEAGYAALVAKYEASQKKAEKAKDEQDAVLERRMREIHEYFGYWMDPKDPRFELMLQQKEAQEKKAEKMAKRAELVKKKIAEVM